MSAGLLFNCDEAIGQWLLKTKNKPFFKFDRCIGIVNNSELVGAVLFHGWNGSNVELSYYGHHTLTLGILRSIALFSLEEFDVARVTCITSKRNRHLMKSLQKIGFKLEGAQRCHYGKHDINRNTGIRFVIFREGIEHLAYGTHKEAA